MPALTAEHIEPLSEKPVAIEYARWRNKRGGYEVTVLEVHHREGPEGGYRTTVAVRGSKTSPTKRVTWPAGVFQRTFEPVGPKLKIPTCWDRIKA